VGEPGSVIFLHLPKTAGSTLRGVMVRQYDPAESHLIARPVWDNFEAFKAWPEAERHRIRFLYGHMGFGLHAWMKPPVTYATMLRDPVERVLSHFHSARSGTVAELRGRIPREMTVGDYVREQVSGELDNGQVRLLSGEPFVEFGGVTRDHLEAAKVHLRDHFAVVGVTERFDEALVMMRDALGWRRRIAYLRRNVTAEPRARVSAEDLAVVRDASRLDAELHAYAAETFDRRVAGLGPRFQRRLRAFRAANALYQAAGTLAAPWIRRRRPAPGLPDAAPRS